MYIGLYDGDKITLFVLNKCCKFISNPTSVFVTCIIILVTFIDFIMCIKRKRGLHQVCCNSSISRTCNCDFKQFLSRSCGSSDILDLIPNYEYFSESFGCCWRYDSKKRVHGRMYISEDQIVFYSPLSIFPDHDELPEYFSNYSGIFLQRVTLIIIEYSRIAKLVRRGGSKVLRGSVTIVTHGKTEASVDLMFCNFLHTKYVYDVLSRLCTLNCKRIYDSLSNKTKLDNEISRKILSPDNPDTDIPYIETPDSVAVFPPYAYISNLLNKNGKVSIIDIVSQEYMCKSGINFDYNIDCSIYNDYLPLFPLTTVFPCTFIQLSISDIIKLLNGKPIELNIYHQYLKLQGVTSIEYEDILPTSLSSFVHHRIYKYKKSLNICGRLGWLTNNTIELLITEDHKLYNFGDELGLILCIEITSSGIPENDAFKIIIRHRFTPVRTMHENITEPNADSQIKSTQLDIECDIIFSRFSLFKYPIIRNTIEQTKSNLELIRNLWKVSSTSTL
ncbi:uncharacterized protein CMU_019260 [Cryptosporidium muris RN66]|uniref:Uncharacterized protein n=1 Tax=Cryptosporidium muris (strain RN66) TaxID=441375 RepID=B6ACB3_CRYMR|nr:uncharacterized protein CMU_019260 [Cryptosporidium muris RN66]EEA06169.1 hypothetical protein, conserved [Cryptosporidium muris RN66]|eukprot:XP_002140518.1 hypothetical protein [Cryptosporidium muris RN66]